ncbi:JAB domain-containing protein [Hafnia sp. HMSC23F03]|uniref:JAB domain-containing protein n=1 Tax=Hafnia sp. HMSC23F03 TaxID=1581059 RepID=UPI0008A35EC8|nr:JAB domain-containing protein [Hafnia sp. HMSC23F03]OFS08312.1 hypothetical protein HMPREF3091_19260 [Hafnia sp. HMSC23F03]
MLTLLASRLRQEPNAPYFTSSDNTKAYLQLAPLEREVFMVLYLDTQYRLIASETTSLGSIRSTEVYPREILKMALFHNALAVILAHNHPSGNTEPSQADRVLTQKLMGGLELIDVRVLYHLIIGDNLPVSFTELGLI